MLSKNIIGKLKIKIMIIRGNFFVRSIVFLYKIIKSSQIIIHIFQFLPSLCLLEVFEKEDRTSIISSIL